MNDLIRVKSVEEFREIVVLRSMLIIVELVVVVLSHGVVIDLFCRLPWGEVILLRSIIDIVGKSVACVREFAFLQAYTLLPLLCIDQILTFHAKVSE